MAGFYLNQPVESTKANRKPLSFVDNLASQDWLEAEEEKWERVDSQSN